MSLTGGEAANAAAMRTVEKGIKPFYTNTRIVKK
jgi:hypothetical protein